MKNRKKMKSFMNNLYNKKILISQISFFTVALRQIRHPISTVRKPLSNLEMRQPAKQAGVAPQEAGYASGDMEVYAVAEAFSLHKFFNSTNSAVLSMLKD